ncbi:hypothetical protein L915_06823 [Phytophthora nicotianae]|uniref:Reverse transcriptase RNase H-like domain-containing protein n=1 Tax=Phytophthora nicotianae TaxID=4792 RepID=W2H3F1_PHYNI|nr:hypothetical protein L915_06823 [Phytophthora nicotianae]
MAPVLRHFDPDRVLVVVVYASDWAISAALVQEYDGTYMPVTFTSRTLKPNELNYGMVEKEILALLRILDVCYSTLVARPIKVLTRHSTLAWLMQSTGLQGRLGNWAALLSPWTLEIIKCTRGEDEILGTTAASITPRESVDSILSSIAPRKQPRQQAPTVIPSVEPGEELLVVRFGGSARVKRGGGACCANVWKLPEWTVVAAESKYLPDLTVNETEYQGWLLAFDLLSSLDRGHLIICGDSNLLKTWPAHELLHVKRDWNQSTDRLANTALHQQEGTAVTLDADCDDLVVLNRLKELMLPKNEESVARMTALTRSRTRSKNSAEVLQLDVVQRIRTDGILRAQNEENKIAEDYDVDDGGLLLYCPRAGRDDGDRDRLAKLVVPEDLQQDVLHHYHTSLEGGHQGVGRTYQRVRAHFH